MDEPKIALLIGAPKCGTSSLFRWLCEHPSIVGTDPKETFLWMDDGHPLKRHVPGYQDWIAGHFRKNATSEWLLEGTTHHLYQQTARQVAQELGTRLHAICVARRPADRVLSSFKYSRDNLSRVDPTYQFNQYVDDLLLNRLDAIQSRVRHKGSAYVLAHELSHSSYAEHLLRWKEVVDNRLSIVIAEEMFANPGQVVQELIACLGVPVAHCEESRFVRHNETRVVGSHRLQSLATIVNKFLPRSKNPIKRLLSKFYFSAQQKMARPVKEDAKASLQRLDEYFEPSLESMEKLMGRELPMWKAQRK